MRIYFFITSFLLIFTLSTITYTQNKIFITSSKSNNISTAELNLITAYFTDLLSSIKKLEITTCKGKDITVISPGLNKLVKLIILPL